MNGYKTNTIALGGILLALTMVFLFGASFVPGVELTLYALSSLFVAVMIIEKGPKQALLLYAAAVVLGFVLIPNKLGILPYACLFGYYGILKFYIEKIKSPVAQVAIKAAFFLVMIYLAFFATAGLLMGTIQMPAYPAAVIFVAGVIFLMLYDTIFTLAIRIYRSRIKREKKPDIKLSQDD